MGLSTSTGSSEELLPRVCAREPRRGVETDAADRERIELQAAQEAANLLASLAGAVAGAAEAAKEATAAAKAAAAVAAKATAAAKEAAAKLAAEKQLPPLVRAKRMVLEGRSAEAEAEFGAALMEEVHEWVWDSSEDWEIDMHPRVYRFDADQDKLLVDIDQLVFDLLQRRMTRQRMEVSFEQQQQQQ